MSDVLSKIAVPEGSVKSPQGLVKSIFSRFGFGFRFAIGLIIFMIGVFVVMMVAKRTGLPTGGAEKILPS